MIIDMVTIITMPTTITTDPTHALLRLMAWLSPAFPVGAFSYSHGLEQATCHGFVTDASSLKDWLYWLVTRGSGWNDAVLCVESWRRAVAGGDLYEMADLAQALASCRERHMETMLQGTAFLSAAQNWPSPVFDRLPADCAYPVAIGALAGAHGIPLESTIAAFLQAFCANLLQVSIRLSVTGQSGMTAIMAALEDVLAETTKRAAQSGLDDLGSVTLISDITAMKHETQNSRLFRS